MASPVSALFGAPNPNVNTASQTSSAPNEQMFLQLLVSQMKNQDPTNPTDPSQFVGQLAQFSELEQLIGIRGDMDKVSAGAAAATQGNTTPGAPATPTNGSSTTPTSNTGTPQA